MCQFSRVLSFLEVPIASEILKFKDLAIKFSL